VGLKKNREQDRTLQERYATSPSSTPSGLPVTFSFVNTRVGVIFVNTRVGVILDARENWIYISSVKWKLVVKHR
jgi:hypothetical protein